MDTKVITPLTLSPRLTGIVVLIPLGIGIAAITKSYTLGFFVVAFGLAAWIIPEWMLFALIGAAPFVRSSNSRVLPPETIIQWKITIAVLLAGVWLARRLLLHEQDRFPNWLILFFLAWFSLTFLATIHAIEPVLAFDYFPYVISGVGAFWVGSQIDERWQRRIVILALIVGGVIAFIGIVQFLITNHDILTSLSKFVLPSRIKEYQQFYSHGAEGTFIQRSTGTLSHPNQLGIYLAILIPISFALINSRDFSVKIRLLIGGTAALLLAGLYTTNSRGALLFACVSLAFLAFHKGHRWLLMMGFGLLFMGSVYFVLTPNKERIFDYFSSHARIETGLSGREEVWSNALDLISTNPVLGVGPGNFQSQYVSRFGYFLPNFMGGEQWEQIWAIHNLGERNILNFHAHSVYLQTFGELGIGGPLLFLIGAILIIVHCKKKAAPLDGNSFSRAMALAVASSAAGMIIYGFFDSQAMLIRSGLNVLIGPLIAIGLTTHHIQSGGLNS